MSHRLIPYEALAAKGLTLSKVQLWRLERDGRFPQRVRPSPGRVAWIESEIDDYLATRPRGPSRPKVAA